jgi:hypothetical protein
LNRSTRKFTGLAGAWQQLLEASGISKSRQEENSPTIMKAVKFHQGNGRCSGYGDPLSYCRFEPWDNPTVLGTLSLSLITSPPP